LLVAATVVPVRAQVSTDALQSITSAVQARQYERALKLIEGALGQSPNDVRLWTLQGMARSGLGNDGEAIISFNHALKLKQDYLPALVGVAQIEDVAGNARGAIPLLRRVLLLRPADQTAHAMLAAMAYKQRDCQSSVEHFGRAATVISSQALALDQYATCLAVLKRPEEAIAVLQKLVTLKPADPQVRMKLATIEFNNQRASDVIQTLRPLVESATPDPDALELVSAAYEAVGDTPRAMEALRKAIGLAPRVNYYLDFADLCLVHGSFQVGIDIVNGGLSLLPDSAPLYLARGILLIQLGKYEQAETDFETAQRIGPNQALGSAAKALAKIQQNNLDQALETVQSQLRQIGRRELLAAAGAGVLRSIPWSAQARGSLASSQITGRLPTPPTPDLANLYEMMDWIGRENQPRLSFLASRWRSLKAKTIFAAGATWPGILVWDDMRSVDYLCHRPEVDAKRIGCLGLSIGGLRTAYLIAADARIKVACVAGWMTEFRTQLRNYLRSHTWMVYIPGLYPSLDLADAAAMTAPGALLVQQCDRDNLYPP